MIRWSLSLSNAAQPPLRRLHRERPAERAVDHRADPRLVEQRARQAREHDQRDGRVVDVGVVQVRALERPAARLHAAHLLRPIAVVAHLVREHPVERTLHVRRELALAVLHGEQRQQRVPHRRLAGLDVQRAAALVRPVAVERREPLRDDGVLEGVALDVERHQAVDPRRLNPAPRAIGVLVAHDPAQARVDRHLATGCEAELLVDSAVAGRTRGTTGATTATSCAAAGGNPSCRGRPERARRAGARAAAAARHAAPTTPRAVTGSPAPSSRSCRC